MDKITVSELAENCNIKRQTFYYHFNNINELISYGTKCYVNEIIQGKRFTNWQNKFEYVLDTIKKDPNSFFRIIMNKTCYDISKCVYDIFEENVREIIDDIAKEYSINQKDEDVEISDYSNYEPTEPKEEDIEEDDSQNQLVDEDKLYDNN